MKCDGDCFDCKYPDCMASEDEIMVLVREERKAARAERRQRRGSGTTRPGGNITPATA